MRTSLALLLAGSALVAAAPVIQKRENGSKPNIDATILQYALTLEHLEAEFYKQGLAKYSGEDFKNAGYEEWVRYRLTEIASHEAAHVDYLVAGLTAAGANATKPCQYSFPDTDPASFLAVAQILEGVGTSAYLGAGPKVTSSAYLGAAASILSIEARHSAWIRSAANNGDAFPEAFETPLEFSEVYTLAAGFITSCPSTNPTLPVKAFPALTLASMGPFASGDSIKFTYANSASSDYVVFIAGAGQTAVRYSADGVKIPEGIRGQVYAVISASNATVTDDTVKAGPAIVEIPVQATIF